jgi:hypothetical protein
MTDFFESVHDSPHDVFAETTQISRKAARTPSPQKAQQFEGNFLDNRFEMILQANQI